MEALAALATGEGLGTVFERLRSEPEKTVGFTIAVIALGAKMAKADGLVTRDEVTAFREVFTIAPDEEKNAAKLFNLARQDVAGFDDYARQIAAMFGDNHAALHDLLEGLFHIATADGTYHPLEDSFLQQVADIFGITQAQFDRLRARLVPDAAPDPYLTLGVSPDMALPEIRKHWQNLVRDTHPDRMQARGVPKEAVKLAEKQLVAINDAWNRICAEKRNAGTSPSGTDAKSQS